MGPFTGCHKSTDQTGPPATKSVSYQRLSEVCCAFHQSLHSQWGCQLLLPLLLHSSKCSARRAGGCLGLAPAAAPAATTAVWLLLRPVCLLLLVPPGLMRFRARAGPASAPRRLRVLLLPPVHHGWSVSEQGKGSWEEEEDLTSGVLAEGRSVVMPLPSHSKGKACNYARQWGLSEQQWRQRRRRRHWRGGAGGRYPAMRLTAPENS
jgi:hypothetical protein